MSARAMGARIRVLVADDHTIVRQGLKNLLEEAEDCEVVAEAGDGVEAVDQAVATRPDVAVLDLTMPRTSNCPPRASWSSPSTRNRSTSFPSCGPGRRGIS